MDLTIRNIAEHVISSSKYVGGEMTKTKKIIVLKGCDSETYIEVDLTKDELTFLRRLSKKSRRISESMCMPVLLVKDLEQ